MRVGALGRLRARTHPTSRRRSSLAGRGVSANSKARRPAYQPAPLVCARRGSQARCSKYALIAAIAQPLLLAFVLKFCSLSRRSPLRKEVSKYFSPLRVRRLQVGCCGKPPVPTDQIHIGGV